MPDKEFTFASFPDSVQVWLVVKITSYTGGFVQTNGYLLETPEGNLLIDAPQGISAWIDQLGVRVDAVLLTHQHYDHVTDAAAMKERGAVLYAYAPYSRDLTLESMARTWGLPIKVSPYQIDHIFETARSCKIAGMELTLAHVPGHSTDSVTFYVAESGVVFSGDTLMARSIGRADLPGGDIKQLLVGITAHLMSLPAETRVLSGHGPGTTIGVEARENPYLR